MAGPAATIDRACSRVYRSTIRRRSALVGGAHDQSRFEQAQHAAADQSVRRDASAIAAPRSRTTSPTWVGTTTSSPSIRSMPDRVWAAGVGWFRSDDGGRTWGMADWGSSGVPAWTHVDQHAMAFHPHYDGSSNQIAMIGNDGGVFRTSNARAATKQGALAPCVTGGTPSVAWTSLNHGYGVTQFYHGTAFPDGVRYIAGAQDNGTLFGQDQNGPDAWRSIFGGDGGYSAPSIRRSRRILYVELQWATLRRSNDTGGTIFVRHERARSDSLVDARSRGELPVRHAVHDGSEHADAALARRRIPVSIDERHDVVEGRLTDAGRGPDQRARRAARPERAPRHRHAQGRHPLVAQRDRQPQRDQLHHDAAARRLGHVDRSRRAHRRRRLRHLRQLRRRARLSQHRITERPGSRSREAAAARCRTSPCIRSSSIRTIRSALYLGTDLGVMVSLDGGRTWMSEETGFGPAVTMWLQIVKATRDRSICLPSRTAAARGESVAKLP